MTKVSAASPRLAGMTTLRSTAVNAPPDAAAGRERRVGVEAIAPGQQEQEEDAEHGEVTADVGRGAQRAALPPQARREGVEEDDDRGGEDERDDRPDVERRFQRQPVDVEAEVRGEVRIALGELAPVVPEPERRPALLRQGEQRAEDEREEDDGRGEVARRHLLPDVDVAQPPRHHERDDGAAHRPEVREDEGRPQRSRQAAEREVVQRAGAPDGARTERLVPAVVHVERGDDPSGDEDEGERQQRRDEPAAARHVRPGRPASAASLPSRAGSPRAAAR